MTRSPAQVLTTDVASAWLAGRVPWWLPGGLAAGWVGAVVLSVASDDQPCSAVDPTVCGPDQAFAVAAVVLLATPVLLFWMPVVGCLAGVVFAVADVRFDSLDPARIAWGAHGVACAMVGAWLIMSRQHQRAVADMSRAVAPPTAHTERWGPRSVVAGLLVLLGAALLARYAYRVAGEQDHLSRAEATVATVVAVADDDYTITVRTRSGQRRTIEVVDTYPVGSRRTVLTDPHDPSWIRLDTEPDDATPWETGGLWCLAFAGLLWWRAVSARRARVRLLTEAQPALAARLDIDDNGNVLIVAADDRYGRRPLAIVPGALASAPALPPRDPDEVYLDGDRAEPDWDDVAAFGRWWRGEEVVDHTRWLPTEAARATVLGRFAEGDWVAVVTDDGVLLPNGPLRPAHPPVRLPWRHRSGAIDRYGAPPGRLAAATELSTAPEAPMTVRQPNRVRLAGVIGALAGFVAAPAAIGLGLPEGWYEYGTMAWIGGWLAVGGLCRATRRLVLDRRGILVPGALTLLHVPWERVPGIRTDNDQIAVAVEPGEVFTFGPFAGPNDAGLAERAERIAAAMCWFQDHALAAGRTGAGSHTTLNPVAVRALVCYAAVVAAALWWRSRYG